MDFENFEGLDDDYWWDDEWQQMVDDCKKRLGRLSEWEIDFIESLDAQLSEHHALSVKQAEKLNEVWEKATEEG